MQTATSRKHPAAAIIVAVIVLIALAALGIPRYLQHRRDEQARASAIRAQVAEGLALSDPARLAVTLYLARFHLSPLDNTAAGLAFPENLGGRYVRSVQVQDGKLVVTYGNRADAAISGKQIDLVPHKDAGGVMRWTCSSGDIDPDYLPADCR